MEKSAVVTETESVQENQIEHVSLSTTTIVEPVLR